MASRALSHFNARHVFFLSPPPPPRTNPNRPSPSSFRPMIVSKAQNQSYWASIEAEVESNLEKAIPIRPPLSVFEPMRYLTLSAPRTTAPALCIAACELVGGARDQAMAAAEAIHLMHATSYTHQHLPVTDRPKPAIHHEHSPNIELLTGDGIMPFGFELLAESMGLARNTPAQILRVIVEISHAVGSQGVIDGQYREMESECGDSLDVETIEYICRMKEGGLHSCGAACGAILGGGSEEEIEKLRNYGLYVGMIQGMVHQKGAEKLVEKFRFLALKELEGFKNRNVEQISSIVQADLCNV